MKQTLENQVNFAGEKNVVKDLTRSEVFPQCLFLTNNRELLQVPCDCMRRSLEKLSHDPTLGLAP